METTDFCSYELSKRLKDCGFDEPCDHLYNCHGNLNRYADTHRINRNTNGHHTPSCSAPTLAHAQKWLREVKRCDVTVYAQPYNGLLFYTGYILFEGNETEVLDDNGQWFDDYEKALSETIAAALELITKGE